MAHPIFCNIDVDKSKIGLGTEFNVKSSNNELKIEVEEGSVELRVKEFFNKVKKVQKALFKK